MNLNSYLTLVLINITYIVCTYIISITYIHSIEQLLHILSRNISVKTYVIYLLLQEFRMSKSGGHFTVIGQQEYTGSISVETAYRIYTLFTSSFYIIHDCLAFLRIIYCSNTIFRFIEQNIDLAFDANQLIMEQYVVTSFYFCSKLGNCL